MSAPVARRLPIPLTLLVVAAGAAGCGGAPRAAPSQPDLLARSPRTADTSTTTSTTTLDDVEAEITRRYLGSWQAWTAAVRTGDTRGLERWFADIELATIYGQVQGLVRDRKRLHERIEHDLEVVVLEADRAVVVDRILDEWFEVDARTDAALAPPALVEEHWQFTLERREGRWVVVFSDKA